MSTQSKTVGNLELKTYIKVVAAVFSISCATAFTIVLLRLMKPSLFYVESLQGTNIVYHYVISGLLVLASLMGFLNSCVVLSRQPDENTGKNITTWLLLDSVFETMRIVYVFISEIVMKGKGPAQIYDLLISGGQYLVDSFLYCQMILRN